MRLQIEPGPPHQGRLRPSPFVCAAAGMGLAALLCVVALLSPALRVQDVVWAGALRPAPARMRAVEKAARGQPLLLLRQKSLRALLQYAPGQVRVDFARHLPGTLQIVVNSLDAVLMLEGVPLDRHGNVLESSRAVPGLPRLRGFALDASKQRLEPESQQQCEQLLDGMARTGLALASVQRRGEDLVLALAQSEVELLVSSGAVDSGLRKLHMLLRRYEASALPARVDLRFRDQIVLREARHGRR